MKKILTLAISKSRVQLHVSCFTLVPSDCQRIPKIIRESLNKGEATLIYFIDGTKRFFVSKGKDFNQHQIEPYIYLFEKALNESDYDFNNIKAVIEFSLRFVYSEVTGMRMNQRKND
jgi:hypothetical protein